MSVDAETENAEMRNLITTLVAKVATMTTKGDPSPTMVIILSQDEYADMLQIANRD